MCTRFRSDVLNHFPGFVGNEGMHKSRRPDGDTDTDHAIHLHYVVGRIIMDLEDVLKAMKRWVRLEELPHLLLSFRQL